MKGALLSISVLMLCLASTSCNQDEELKDTSGALNETSQIADRKNINISILLDLSDRINPEKAPTLGVTIVERDLGYIKTISEVFESHLRGSKIVTANDHIQVFFEPEPMNTSINKLAKQMQISFNKQNLTKEALHKLVPDFQQASAKIYKLALADKHFVGSDIWTFFKSKVKDYCIRPKHRNILIILTDGYMLHMDNRIKERNQTTYLTTNQIKEAKLNTSGYKELMNNNKIGFIPATSGLGELEVLVLGVDAVKGRNYEQDIIVKYWQDWFIAMGIKKYEIKAADLPNNLDPYIKKFISSKTL